MAMARWSNASRGRGEGLLACHVLWHVDSFALPHWPSGFSSPAKLLPMTLRERPGQWCTVLFIGGSQTVR